MRAESALILCIGRADRVVGTGRRVNYFVLFGVRFVVVVAVVVPYSPSLICVWPAYLSIKRECPRKIITLPQSGFGRCGCGGGICTFRDDDGCHQAKRRSVGDLNIIGYAESAESYLTIINLYDCFANNVNANFRPGIDETIYGPRARTEYPILRIHV